ncbi:putative lysis protein S [Escherichia coli]|uniref:Putative lysis protein S n=1 Tax=Escherichia coli TaxID=562 RepID=A0A376L5Q1_ECOLX|nr:putative lysis protein S [Escherichia coli]
MYQMEKSQQVCHTPRQRVGTGYWFLQLLDRGFPVSVGGNRRAGESAVWAADISD